MKNIIFYNQLFLQKTMIKIKNDKKKQSKTVVEKPKVVEVKNNKQKEFEKCSACPDIEIMNMTRFTFGCGHWFHSECYEMTKLSFNGSLCPICFCDERFDFFNQDIASTSKPGQVLRLDIDHSFAMLSSDIFYDGEKSKEIWSNIEVMSDQRTMLNIEPSDIELYSKFDPNDHEVLLKRANHTLKLNANQKKIKRMRKMFVDAEPIEKIIAMRYTMNDMKMGGITLEFLVKHGYNIKNIYDLGFRSWKDLRDLKFNSNIMTILDDDHNAYINVQFLVDYYYISYKDLINLFSHQHLEVVKHEEVSHQKAIMEFCRLNMTKDELIKLRLQNINILFSIYGKNAFNADCLVEFCKGHDVNKVHVLQHVFKFDGTTLDNIKGFTNNHLIALDWKEGHFFGDMVREQLALKYNITKVPSSSHVESDVEEEDEEEDYDESSSEYHEEEEDEDSYEDTSDDDNGFQEPEPIPGMDFTDKRSEALSSSLLASSSSKAVLPKTTISINLYNDEQPKSPSVSTYSGASSSQATIKRPEVIRKRNLE